MSIKAFEFPGGYEVVDASQAPDVPARRYSFRASGPLTFVQMAHGHVPAPACVVACLTEFVTSKIAVDPEPESAADLADETMPEEEVWELRRQARLDEA